MAGAESHGARARRERGKQGVSARRAPARARGEPARQSECSHRARARFGYDYSVCRESERSDAEVPSLRRRRAPTRIREAQGLAHGRADPGAGVLVRVVGIPSRHGGLYS